MRDRIAGFVQSGAPERSTGLSNKNVDAVPPSTAQHPRSEAWDAKRFLHEEFPRGGHPIGRPKRLRSQCWDLQELAASRGCSGRPQSDGGKCLRETWPRTWPSGEAASSAPPQLGVTLLGRVYSCRRGKIIGGGVDEAALLTFCILHELILRKVYIWWSEWSGVDVFRVACDVDYD